MTSRLKRKLNDIGVDLSSNKATENFCLIGTPLPPLEKTKDANEFVPVWKQDVRDEKGRRRLHGAFTGGFSAGYFNTVGSKEGWTPSTFVSSRTDRAKTHSARPEDYMDEEDLAELREGQKLVDTHESMDVDFWAPGGRKVQTAATGTEDDSLLNALESALLPAPTDSAGARLLKKMGWRLGSGVGPKVTYEQRKRQDALASDTQAGPSFEDHDEAKKHLYPPRDTRVPLFTRKENAHGLGYVPEKGLLDQVSAGEGKGGPSISAGFGLGALNDAEDDDIDIYEGGVAGQSRSSRRLAYDAEDDGEGDGRITMGGKGRGKLPTRTAVPVQLPPGMKLTFRDGSRCLPGFAVAEKVILVDKKYAPPKVPEGWTPNPRRVWEADKENIKQRPAEDNRTDAQGKSSYRNSNLSSEQRGSMLGETPLPIAPKSIFDYLKPEDRKRLQNLAEGKVDVVVKEKTPEPPEPPVSNIPRLDAQVAKMALQGFQPYASDPVRQARYTIFLRAYAGGEDASALPPLPGQSAEARAKELGDFASSAQVFRPVSAAMAGRFTSASVFETGPKAVEGLHTLGESSYLSRPASVPVEETEKKEESPKEHAARMGMFGPLTREAKTWIPAKLLCKRFGVRPPEVETMDEQYTSSANGQETSQPDKVLAITGPDSSQATSDVVTKDEELPTSSSGKTKRDLAHIGLGEDETQGQDILTYERPSMDIFKAIFASDDEDSADEDDPPEGKEVIAKESHAESVEPEAVKDPEPAEVRYEPSGWNGEFNNAAGMVELTSFKPTFVPRRKDTGEPPKSKKERSDKKHGDKKKKGKAVLVSFEVEEGDLGSPALNRETNGKERKKKKRREEKAPAEDEDMWVEAPQPDVVQTFATHETLKGQLIQDVDGKEAAGPQRGRKRAVDFL